MSNALQDVIFVDVSSIISQNKTLTPIEILRTIFIDINTNAKSVGIVKRILMDDKDLASLCVQSLVESVTKEGITKDVKKFVPSILIDWDGHSLKHDLPHITGVLTLYQTLSDELVSDRLVSINDHRDQKKIQYFINLLNDVFFVDKTIKELKDNIDIITLAESFTAYLGEKNSTREVFAQELQEEVMDSILFNYDYRTLEIAQENFEKYFLEAIVSVFAALKPYYLVIEGINDLKGFDSKTTLHAALLMSRVKAFASSNTKLAFLEARQKLIDDFHPRFYLIYTVVGQKAIFKCIFERVWSSYKYGITPDTIQKIFLNFIEKFNSLLDLLEHGNFKLFGKEEIEIIDNSNLLEEFGSIYSSFWEGILFEDKRIVYNSQGVRALADVINLALSCMEERPGIQSKTQEEYSIRYAEQRIKRLLKKRFSRTEDEYQAASITILNNKKLFLLEKITEIKNSISKAKDSNK